VDESKPLVFGAPSPPPPPMPPPPEVTPPVITLFGGAVITLTQTVMSAMWEDPGFSSVDNLEGSMSKNRTTVTGYSVTGRGLHLSTFQLNLSRF
jgi:hypothetical protein